MTIRIGQGAFCTAVFVCLCLASAGPLFAQGKTARNAQAQNSCPQITKACKAAGFTPGGKKGSRLRKDCIEPILQGQTQPAQGGHALPSVDPAIVSACRSGQSAAATPDLSVPPSVSPGGVHLQLPPTVVNNSDGLRMSDPQPLFTGSALGMQQMPDQQTPILRSSQGLYQLFVTGVVPGQPGGVVSLFTTPDLTKPSLYQTSGVVLTPPVRNLATACKSNGGDSQARYIGMEAVIPAGTPHNLVGFYIADQKCSGKAFYGQLGFATATQDGASWTCHGPTLRGASPSQCKSGKGPAAFNQPTVIKVGNYYYAYFAIPTLPGSGISVARAPVGNGGAPGSWSVMSRGQWTAVSTTTDNVQTITSADLVVPIQGYVTMPWVSYNTYLKTYLMTMVTHDGFYYSKLQSADMDAQRWTAPQLFEPVPGGKNWVQCQVTWENVSFVTPGLGDNYTTGKDGYVVLSIMPGWGCPSKGSRSFALASYSFGVTTPPAPPPIPQPHPLPTPRPAPCRSSQPCQK
jgi:hypothetical protein